MYNWSTDTTTLKKTPKKYAIWRLEQLINFGLGDEKLSIFEVKKYWNQLNIDPKRKNVLAFWMR